MHQPPHVLVVDDEMPVLMLAAAILQRAGIDVMTARGGREALRAVERDPEWIDLLLSDVVMPDLEGPALAEDCRRLRPGLPVLLMTGYVQRATLTTIMKPFKPDALLKRVREALQAPGAA